jgi:hypothetical protein
MEKDIKTHTYENGVTLTLAQRFALDAVEVHRSRLYNTAHERVSDGSHAEFGPLSVQDVEDAADEAREIVRRACGSDLAGATGVSS